MTKYGSEKSPELVDDVCDKLRQIMERFNDRITSSNLRLSERYLDRDIHVLVEFSLLLAGIREDYVAHFERGDFGIGRENHLAVVDRHTKGHSDSIQKRAEVDPFVSGTDSQQEAVLVGVVQFVEYPELVSCPTLVRLSPLKDFYREIPKTLYLTQSGTVFRGIASNRKVNTRVPRASCGEPELHSCVVQGTAQVEDRVSSDERDAGGNLREPNDNVIDVSSIRIVLARDFAWAGVLESDNCGIEISDVLIGPFEFQSGT